MTFARVSYVMMPFLCAFFRR